MQEINQPCQNLFVPIGTGDSNYYIKCATFHQRFHKSLNTFEKDAIPGNAKVVSIEFSEISFRYRP